MKKITIKDIAKMADVSPGAVSLVLNNRPCRVSVEKKATIKRIAKEHHYAANQIARSLVTRKSKTIGLIIPDIENIFFSSLAKHIEQRCREKGYLLMIVNSDNKYKHDLELLELLRSRSVDGLFLIPSDESYEDNSALIGQLQHLDKAGFPYVMVDRIYSDHTCNKVWFNNEEGAYLAVSHLLEKGHQNIACIANSSDALNGKSRLTGYYRAMRDYGCEIVPDIVIEGDYRMASGFQAGRRLLDQDISAVFVTNDMMALGLLKVVYERNLKIPDDLSVVSYDNTINPYIFGVELTAIEQDVSHLSDQAVDLLFTQLESQNSNPKEICLIPKLVKNTSVRELTKN